MKAIDIMLFLLLFNVMISVVGAAGLNIYGLGVEPEDEKFDAENLAEGNTGDKAYYYFIGGFGAALLVVGTGIGAVVGVATGRPTAEYAAYGFFAALVTAIFVSSYSILSSIAMVIPENARFGVQIVIGLFIGISGIMVALGFMQLIRGGVSSHM